MNIIITDSPSSVDSFLKKKYKIGLWELSMSFVDLLMKEVATKNIGHEAFIVKEEINKLENIKHSLIKRLDDHQEKLNFIKNNEENSIQKYNLTNFVKKVDNEIIDLKSHQLFTAKKNLESHLKFHNKVASIWSQFFVKNKLSNFNKWKKMVTDLNVSSKGIDWDIISDLLEWFKERFKGTNYSYLFDENREIDPSVLRRQYYKFMNKYKNQIIGDTLTLFWPWILFENIKKLPFKWIGLLPKNSPFLMIKIEKTSIEFIDIKKEKNRKVIYISFPNGETLP